MGIKPLTIDELREISKLFNLDLSHEELEKFSGLLSIQLKSYERLERLPEFKPTVKYRSPGSGGF